VVNAKRARTPVPLEVTISAQFGPLGSRGYHDQRVHGIYDVLNAMLGLQQARVAVPGSVRRTLPVAFLIGPGVFLLADALGEDAEREITGLGYSGLCGERGNAVPDGNQIWPEILLGGRGRGSDCLGRLTLPIVPTISAWEGPGRV
jgi:hypothetical protein